MAEWDIEFKDNLNNSHFRLDQNQYYKYKSGRGLRNMDHCLYTGKSLDFIECKEVNKPTREVVDCALKGVHSIAVVKTGLLKKEEKFLNDSDIPVNVKINAYFIFNADSPEQKSQLLSMEPFIVKNIRCFSLLWDINEVKVMSYDQAVTKLNYIKHD